MILFLTQTELAIVLVIALVLFGGSQLPKLAKNLGSAQKEFNEINSTGQAMLALPPFKSSNTIVLSAKKPMSETSVLAQDSNQKRVDILRLHPGAKQVWVESGHAIPLEKPAATTGR